MNDPIEVYRQLHNDKSCKPPLIILTGPTAVGKTALSISLAKALSGEMISADSMQVYRGLNIGTAKVTEEEMQGIPHYLIDVLEPTEDFNVFIFQRMAKDALCEIYKKGKIPILVGGTGFYIQALLYDICFEETKESPYREELTRYQEKYGAHALHALLKDIDPVSYKEIHENNVKRVIRAIEFYKETGYPISEHNKQEREKESPYNFVYFVLNDERSRIYDRIETRIDRMLTEGLVEEVAVALQNGCTKDMVSMQGLGYKEIIPYLQKERSIEDAIYILKRDTRHFAKRQLTWFRREREVTWVNRTQFENEQALLQFMLQTIRKKGI